MGDKKIVKKLKFVVVGDATVGKTCLISAYVNRTFSRDYRLSLLEQHNHTIKVDGQTYEVEIVDTAGQEAYVNIRALVYEEASCFLVCFSVDDSETVENIKYVWAREIKKHSSAPIVLVGCKTDLREKDPGCLSERVGFEFMKTIKAKTYVECSALDGTNLDTVFETALKVVLLSSKKKSGCCIL